MSAAEFNEILLSHSGSLRPFAVSLTHDQEAAKDLYQETVYRALANRDKYCTGTNIKAWLLTIMRNVFINDYRRKVKQRTIFDNCGDEHMGKSAKAIVCNGAESSLQLKEINKVIYQLPHIFKTPFLLYFEGYRYHEIAYSLNEPLGTIKSRIYFARKLLKDQLTENKS
jgi:RNA polymerase sigma factor (sigma-70 family)